MNIWVELVYEAVGKPYPIGRTDSLRMLVMVKRQLIAEAEEKCKLAEGADEILEIAWKGDLRRLHELLDLLIPKQMEELTLQTGGSGDRQGQNES